MIIDKQRKALIKTRGKPKLRLEFDVFEGNKVSMWTHFKHGDDFQENQKMLEAIRDHLKEFLKDASMCPFEHD